MNLEDQLRAAKFHDETIAIKNKSQFKDQLNKRMMNIENPKRKFKKKWLAIAIPLIALPLAGWGYQQYTMWNQVHISKVKNDKQPVPTVAAIWSNSGLQTITSRAKHVTNLAVSRSKAGFPIYEPNSITGWKRIFSEGYTSDLYIQHVVNHHNVTQRITEGPLTYLDVYENPKGERVAILQQKSNFNVNSPSVYVQYSHGTQYLDSFKPDFAALIPIKIVQGQGDPRQLSIFHQNQDHTITNFEITGTAPPQTLEMFGHKYVNAPTK